MVPLYTKETRGIRVTVRPQYLPDHSQPLQLQYVFAYFVRIENTSKRKLKLLSRHWVIVDSIGEEREIDGEGVVGEQPVLTAGDVHEYHSYCVLKSPQGYMEGSYRFIGLDDVLFEAEIPRFILTADESSWSLL